MTDDRVFGVQRGAGRLIATAVHEGSHMRASLLPHVGLDEAGRRREEDPGTGDWTRIAPTRVVGTHSRFQVDLNRPRAAAVYRVPADCWGLELYTSQPPEAELAKSLAGHDDFYAAMHDLLSDVVRKEGRFVVYDLHSYNHRRDGAHATPADPAHNPQVNVGTGSVKRDLWHPVVDTFINTLRGHPFPGEELDVRENVKFKGGNWSCWVNEHFGTQGVALAIEVKKFYMDEWSGSVHSDVSQAVEEALRATVGPVLDALATIELPSDAP